MRKPATVKTESIDVHEAVSLIDDVSGLLSIAEAALADLEAIFEAIVAATPAESLEHRLADLGRRNAEVESDTFGGYRNEYNVHAKRLATLLQTVREVSHG